MIKKVFSFIIKEIRLEKKRCKSMIEKPGDLEIDSYYENENKKMVIGKEKIISLENNYTKKNKLKNENFKEKLKGIAECSGTESSNLLKYPPNIDPIKIKNRKLDTNKRKNSMKFSIFNSWQAHENTIKGIFYTEKGYLMTGSLDHTIKVFII